MNKPTSTERYAAARKILVDSKLPRMVYYNSYARSRALKVCFFIWDEKYRKPARRVLKQLAALADYTNDGSRGYIFGFTKEAK